jgi:hypothetical protein
MIPILILSGEAGSGKDTLGAHLAEELGGITIGFADPLKQMARDFFGFTDEQLYGPSECRNKIDTRFADQWEILKAVSNLFSHEDKWAERLFPGRTEEAMTALRHWFDDRAKIDNGLSPRFVLQTLGTEWGRALDPQIWIKAAVQTGKDLLCGGYTYTRQGGLVSVEGQAPYNLVLVTDGRFPNEAIITRSMGCKAIRIERPSKEDTTTTGVAGHASEALLKTTPHHFYDAVVINDDDIAAFKSFATQLVKCMVCTKQVHHVKTWKSLGFTDNDLESRN